MQDLVRIMKALSDSNRLKMIKILQKRTLCVCEIREALGLAQPSVSKHLKILEEAGLVAWVKEGLWVNYFVPEKVENAYGRAFLGHLRHWLDEDEEVALLLERLPEIQREEICARARREAV